MIALSRTISLFLNTLTIMPPIPFRLRTFGIFPAASNRRYAVVEIPSWRQASPRNRQPSFLNRSYTRRIGVEWWPWMYFGMP